MVISWKTDLIWKKHWFGTEIFGSKGKTMTSFPKVLEVHWRRSRPSPWTPSDLDVLRLSAPQSALSQGKTLGIFSHKASYFSCPIKFSVSRGFDGGLNPASLSCLCKLSFDVSENTSMNRWKHTVTSCLIHANTRTLLCACLISHQRQKSLVPKRSFLLPRYWHFI